MWNVWKCNRAIILDFSQLISSQTLIQGEFKSDFASKLCNEKAPPLMPRTSKSAGNINESTRELLNNPEDFLKLLNWHSDELKRQNAQIKQLLDDKKQSQEQFLNLQLQINDLQKQVHELKDSQKIKMPSTYLPMKEITKPAMIDSATQMSNPSSPNRPR